MPDVGGIDPQIYFEGDRAWMVNHQDPAGPSKYDGHKAIWIREISPRTFQPIGPAKMLVDGGVNIAEKPGYVEGPHIFKKDGYYYLSAAEGGTGTDHRQVIWRSREIMGPYETNPDNPILTQRDLPANRAEPITSTGHADLFETQDGSWWAVFLGTRNYDEIHFNTGRETFLLPVEWKNGWPRILRGNPVPYVGKGPALPRQPVASPTSGNFTSRVEFDGPLGPEWMFVRVPQSRWWQIENGALHLTPRDDRLGSTGQPSIVARRIQHMNATATTRVQFSPGSARDEAGLAALQNDQFYYAFGFTTDEAGRSMLKIRRRSGTRDPEHGQVVATVPLALKAGTPVHLRVKVNGPRLSFFYSLDGNSYRVAAADLEANTLSTMRADGFNGATIGLYAEARLSGE